MAVQMMFTGHILSPISHPALKKQRSFSKEGRWFQEKERKSFLHLSAIDFYICCLEYVAIKAMVLTACFIRAQTESGFWNKQNRCTE